MSIKITGLSELQDKLRNLSDNAKALNGQHNVRFSEIFSVSFLQRYTQFGSIDEMFAKSGFKVQTQDDFKAIPDDQWDTFISSHTQFKNWAEMKSKASAEWAKQKLGL